MGSAIFNLVIGLLTIAAALSGRFVFPGTDSPTALVVLGVAISALGVYQIVRLRR